MLIPTYYLLSKICDIFATRRRILLEINKNYFRGGEVIRSQINRCIKYKNPCSSLSYTDFFLGGLAFRTSTSSSTALTLTGT